MKGKMMHVKIISKRVFKIKKKEKLIPLLGQLRKNAEKQKGFISRSTYSSLSDPGEYIVISEWETADDWIEWKNDKKTRKIQGDIDSLIGEKTFFNIFRPEEF
jgi:heme oxygenase (mycobilin-producing)